MLETHYLVETKQRPVDVEAAMSAAAAAPEPTDHKPVFAFSSRASGQDVYKLALDIMASKKKADKVADAAAFKRVCHAFKKDIENGHTIPAKLEDVAKGVLHPHSQDRDAAVDRPAHTQVFTLGLMLFSRDDTLSPDAIRDFLKPSIRWAIRYSELQPGYDRPQLDDAKVYNELTRAKEKAEAYREEEESAQAEKDEQDPELKGMRKTARGDGKDTMYSAKELCEIAKACGVKPDDLGRSLLLPHGNDLYVASPRGYIAMGSMSSKTIVRAMIIQLSPFKNWGATSDSSLFQKMIDAHSRKPATSVWYSHLLGDSRGRVVYDDGETNLERSELKMRAIEPKYSEGVNEWLSLMTDRAEELNLQLAAAWELDVKWPAILHLGAGGTGKGTLVDAIAMRFGTSSPKTQLGSLLKSQFGSTQLRGSPVVELQEGWGKERPDWHRLKEMVVSKRHHFEAKGKDITHLIGYLRLCVNVNDASDLIRGVSVHDDDITAFARRFVVHRVRDHRLAADAFRKLMGSEQADHSDALVEIAQHIAYLNESLREKARLWCQTFLGNDSAIREFFVSNDKRAEAAYDLLRWYLIYSRAQNGRVSDIFSEEGQIYWRPGALKDLIQFKRSEDSSASDLHLNSIGLVKLLSNEEQSKRVRGEARKYSPLKMDLFWQYVDAYGYEKAEILQGLSNIELNRQGGRAQRAVNAQGLAASQSLGQSS